MTKTLLLLENSSNQEKIISEIKNFENLKIICFDIESSDILSNLKIEHDLMENYLNSDDEQIVENLALEKSFSWYKNKEIEQFLKFDTINLGWLLEVELHHYFLQTMKHLLGLIKVIQHEKPSKIFASYFLNSLLENSGLKSEIHTTSFSKNDSVEFISNKIEFPISFGTKTINIKASRSFALRFKSFIEFMTNQFFDLKYAPSTSHQRKKFLLLEFNPIQYRELISQVKSIGDDIILLNDRLPAVFNFESLNVVKNTKSKILVLSAFESDISEKIHEEQKNLSKKLNELFSKDDIFSNLFSINGYSFWLSIKKDFISICEKRFSEAIYRYLCSTNFFENNKVNGILTMYNAGFEERIILFVAQKFNIPTILMQHGIYGENKILQKFIPVLGFLPTLNSKEAIWGNETKIFFNKLGINDSDLILSGSPRHDSFFKVKPSLEPTNCILLATNVIMGQNYKGYDSRLFKNYEKTLKKLILQTHNIPQKKLIIKLHPGRVLNDVIPKILKEIDFPLTNYKTGNILDFIINSDVVVSAGFSTVLIEAMILKKPTITLLFDENGFHDEPLIKNGATIYVKNLDEYSQTLQKILNDDEFKTKLIAKGSEFVDKYLVNKGNSSHFLAKYLHDI